MTTLPERPAHQPNANPAGQPTIDDQAAKFIAAIEDALQTPTRHRDDTPTPTIGTRPPVPQPGRPPMSQKAVDASTLMLSAGAASLPVGAVTIGILIASGHANPTVIGLVCAAPAAIAVPILAIARMLRRAKETTEATPPEIHQHYTGNVYQDQRSIHTQTRGVWARTRNELPE